MKIPRLLAALCLLTFALTWMSCLLATQGNAYDLPDDPGPSVVADGCGEGSGCPCSVAWDTVYGAPGFEQVADVAVDAAGNVILVGRFQGTVRVAGGPPLTSAGKEDILIVKLDPSGAPIWSKSFGGPDSDRALTVAVDATGYTIVTGWTESTIDFGGDPLTPPVTRATFFVGLNVDGGYVTSFLLSATVAESINDTAFDKDGNIYLGGWFEGAINLGKGIVKSNGRDGFVLHGKTSVEWVRIIAGPEDQVVNGVVADAAGNGVVTGSFRATTDLGPSVTSDGGDDAFIVKLAADDGDAMWHKVFGDAANQRGTRVVVDASDDVIMAGEFEGKLSIGGSTFTKFGSEFDMFAAKLAGDSGSPIWSKGFGSAGLNRARGLAVDGAGNIFMTGSFQETVDFGNGGLKSAGSDDIFFLKMTPEGDHACSLRFGSPTSQIGQALAVQPNGVAYLGGELTGEVDFGFGPRASSGSTDEDGFLLKIKP